MRSYLLRTEFTKVENMRKEFISVMLISALMLSACNGSSAGSSSDNSSSGDVSSEVTTVGVESSDTSSEETTSVETTVDKLDISMEDVENIITNAMGDDFPYRIICGPKDENDSIKQQNESVGILDYRVYHYYAYEQSDGSFSEEQTAQDQTLLMLCFSIYEFDMTSEAYKELSVGSPLTYYWTNVEGAGQATVLAINKQFVYCYGIVSYGENKETEPPFTIGNVQAGYEAFISLS